jgi:cysteine-rich repeat protein
MRAFSLAVVLTVAEVLAAAPLQAREYRLVRSVPTPLGITAMVEWQGKAFVGFHGGAGLVDLDAGQVVRTYTVQGDREQVPAAVTAASGYVVFSDPFSRFGGPGGSVYVFDGDTAVLRRTLEAPQPAERDFFGSTVVAVGTTLFVGAPGFGNGEPGAVHAFDLESGGLQRTLRSPTPHADDYFGAAIAAIDGRVLVGAPRQRVGDAVGGAAHLFDVADGTLVGSLFDPTPSDLGDAYSTFPSVFGSHVAFRAGELVVSDPATVADAPPALHLFDGTTGALRMSFPALSEDGPGFAVPGMGDDLFIAVPSFNSFRRGGVYLANASSGVVREVLTRPVGSAGRYNRNGYGVAVALVGGRLVVSDELYPTTTAPRQGKLFVYADTTACGDGALDADEACDDGNDVNGDGCDRNCRETACGNGEATVGEECDDGDLVDGDGCDSNCRPSVCGNGIVTPPEQCDSGNEGGGGGCDHDCRFTSSTTITVTTTSTTRPPSACELDSSVCDDADPCTADGCAGGRCAHDPVGGIEAVTCLLDGAALRTPSCTGLAIPAAVNDRLGDARALIGDGGRRQLRRATRLLTQAGTFVARARRQRKLRPACAREMTQLIDAVRADVRALRQGRTP